MADVVIFSDGERRSLGPYRIASEIRAAGHSCQVVSFITYFSKEEIELVCKKFIDANTKIVGLSTTFWYGDVLSYSFLQDKIREVNPSVKVILGGPNAKRIASLTRHKIDAILSGQGESNILKYLNHITTGSAFVEPTDIFRDNIPLYESKIIADDWNFNSSQTIYLPSDAISPGEPLVLEVGRGCIFSCSFCAYPLNGKKKLDHIKYADTIYEELIRNYNDHGTHNYILSDDTFNDSLEKLHILKDVFKSLPFKLTFSSYARLDLLHAHQEEIELLEDMGMMGANFGVETFYEKSARLVGKGMVGKIAKDFLHELKTVHWKGRIKIAIGLIQGFPYETLESHEETRQWILDEENNHIESIQPHTLSVINPLKDIFPYKSEFQLNATKYGFYWPDSANPGNWKNYIGPVKSAKEANALYRKADEATRITKRQTQGGFGMSAGQMWSQYCPDPKTLAECIAMDRYQYSDWSNTNGNIGFKNFINWYKATILSL
jgi:radical SAM superfamily enzyme YgiQ (UPF0313 family)